MSVCLSVCLFPDGRGECVSGLNLQSSCTRWHNVEQCVLMVGGGGGVKWGRGLRGGGWGGPAGPLTLRQKEGDTRSGQGSCSLGISTVLQ